MFDPIFPMILVWHLAGLVLLFIGWRRMGRGEVIFPERLAAVPGFGAVVPLIAYCVMVLGTLAPVELARQSGFEPGSATLAAVTALSQLLVCVVIVSAVGLRHGSNELRLWFTSMPMAQVLKLSAVVILVALPLILRLHQFLSTWLLPYEHGTLDAIQQAQSSGVVFWRTLHTVLVTPVLEELLYRGLVLGALFRWAALLPKDPEAMLLGEKSRSVGAEAGLSESLKPRSLPFWPVWVAALLFAFAHLGQGAAPISLFVLAVIFGETVRRTRSLWPAILSHLFLNGYSIAMALWNR